jgi:hypothetical protein
MKPFSTPARCAGRPQPALRSLSGASAGRGARALGAPALRRLASDFSPLSALAQATSQKLSVYCWSHLPLDVRVEGAHPHTGSSGRCACSTARRASLPQPPDAHAPSPLLRPAQSAHGRGKGWPPHQYSVGRASTRHPALPVVRLPRPASRASSPASHPALRLPGGTRRCTGWLFRRALCLQRPRPGPPPFLK